MTIKLDKNFDKSKLTKNLAAGNILAPFLDKAFDTFDEPFSFDYVDKEHDDAWHPSGDCLPKVTDLYAKATGVGEPKVISGSLRKSFMVGHYWHQVIQYIVLHKLQFCEPRAIELVGRRFWGEGTLIKRQWWSPTRPLSGDAIVSRPYHWVQGAGDIAPLETPKWTGVVDIKTMSSNQFKANTLPEWAEAKYTCQLNIYLDLFDQEQGMILAVNKDAPHNFKEYMFTRDQKLIDAIYAKWKFVSECLDNDMQPTEKDNEEFTLPI